MWRASAGLRRPLATVGTWYQVPLHTVTEPMADCYATALHHPNPPKGALRGTLLLHAAQACAAARAAAAAASNAAHMKPSLQTPFVFYLCCEHFLYSYS